MKPAKTLPALLLTILLCLSLAACSQNAAANKAGNTGAKTSVTSALEAGISAETGDTDPATGAPLATPPATAAEETRKNGDSRADLDLSVLSPEMIYAEVYNMLYYPEEYEGKTIKIEGTFFLYHDENNGQDYTNCIIQDATACCAQGMEFRLKDGAQNLEEGQEIAVIGTFGSYIEDGVEYCSLMDAQLLPVNE